VAFRRSRLAFLAQYRDSLFEVALRFNQRRAAIVESRVGAVPQFFTSLAGFPWLYLVYSSFSLCLSWNFRRTFLSKILCFLQNGPPRMHRGGPKKNFLPALD